MSFTVIGDVEVDYGPVPDGDVERVEKLIDRVEAWLEVEVPDLASRVSSGRTTVERIAIVVAELVTGVLRNPTGLRSFSRTEGPFSTSGTYASDAGEGGGLSARHLRLLGILGARGAFTIMPGYPR